MDLWPIQRISMTEKPEPDFQMDIGNKLQSTVSKSAPTTFPLVIQDKQNIRIDRLSRIL